MASVRNAVESRTPLTVQSYNTVVHGDTLADDSGEIGESLNLHTSQLFHLRRNATAQDKLASIINWWDI